MPSEATVTVIKMLESLPEEAQERVVHYLREYIEDLKDELEWDRQFKETQTQLLAAARRAREEIASGQATPLDHDKL